MSQHDLAAKSCPVQNFVIWSRISKIFYRNDHHIETTCRAQHLGQYLEGQGHSMTFQHNCVRPITSLLEVLFKNYFTKMITMLRRHVAHNIWVAFWRSGHSMTFQHNCVRPITSLFEVLFKNYFIWIITMLRRRVAYNIWVTTLKVKIIAWSFSKIVFGT